jgi:hypothetical protein
MSEPNQTKSSLGTNDDELASYDYINYCQTGILKEQYQDARREHGERFSADAKAQLGPILGKLLDDHLFTLLRDRMVYREGLKLLGTSDDIIDERLKHANETNEEHQVDVLCNLLMEARLQMAMLPQTPVAQPPVDDNEVESGYDSDGDHASHSRCDSHDESIQLEDGEVTEEKHALSVRRVTGGRTMQPPSIGRVGSMKLVPTGTKGKEKPVPRNHIHPTHNSRSVAQNHPGHTEKPRSIHGLVPLPSLSPVPGPRKHRRLSDEDGEVSHSDCFPWNLVA